MCSADEDLHQLLAKLEERESLVPDELVESICRMSGCEVNDVKAVRLLGLATHKFIKDIMDQTIHLSRARDRLPFSRLKDQGFNPKDKTRVLLLEELVRSLKQVNLSMSPPSSGSVITRFQWTLIDLVCGQLLKVSRLQCMAAILHHDYQIRLKLLRVFNGFCTDIGKRGFAKLGVYAFS